MSENRIKQLLIFSISNRFSPTALDSGPYCYDVTADIGWTVAIITEPDLFYWVPCLALEQYIVTTVFELPDGSVGMPFFIASRLGLFGLKTLLVCLIYGPEFAIR